MLAIGETGGGGNKIWEFSVLSLNFSVNLKTALKK